MNKLTKDWIKRYGGTREDLRWAKTFKLEGYPIDRLFMPELPDLEGSHQGFKLSMQDMYRLQLTIFEQIRNGAEPSYNEAGFLTTLSNESYSLEYTYDKDNNRVSSSVDGVIVYKSSFNSQGFMIEKEDLTNNKVTKYEHLRTGILKISRNIEENGVSVQYRHERSPHKSLRFYSKEIFGSYLVASTYQPHMYISLDWE